MVKRLLAFLYCHGERWSCYCAFTLTLILWFSWPKWQSIMILFHNMFVMISGIFGVKEHKRHVNVITEYVWWSRWWWWWWWWWCVCVCVCVHLILSCIFLCSIIIIIIIGTISIFLIIHNVIIHTYWVNLESTSF